MGEWCLKNLERGGYSGEIYPVNPGYDDLGGRRCYARLSDLPETPDVVVFAVGDHRLEQSLDEAIECGIPAAVIMSSLYLDNDETPDLRERVQKKLDDSRMLVCGANGMGFYNYRDNTWCCGFDSREHPADGNISLISHSGSGMCGIVDCDERLRINFAVSTGNELTVTMDEYLDFVLDLPETRVVGLFVETARNPRGFREALGKAVSKEIPIVALKVGRTKKSAELAVSHSGAMAGDDATYEALFDRYGVHRVDDMDEFATALILFAELNPIGSGGLVTLHDSGGERQLIVDLADAAGVPLTRLSEETVAKIETVLEPELPAINPLDAWSRGGDNSGQIMTDCLTYLLQDPDAAIGGLIMDRAPTGSLYASNLSYIDAAHKASGKPVALVSSRQGTGYDKRAIDVTHGGLPVLDGIVPFLKSVRGLMDYRDFLGRPGGNLPSPPTGVAHSWSARFRSNPETDESIAMSMLEDFGVPCSRSAIVRSAAELSRAAIKLKWPLVLKTAMRGLNHKSDVGGVRLDIDDEDELSSAYAELSERLGPKAIVAEMAEPGVEMFLGARTDPQFGPVVMIGIGGIYAEILKDVQFALPPFDAAHARRLLDRLTMRPLLDGKRGGQPAAIDAFCQVAARFSVMVDAMRNDVAEVDVNPVIVGPNGCVAVDALVVLR